MEKQLKWFTFIVVKIFSNCFKFKTFFTQNHNQILPHTYLDSVGEDVENQNSCTLSVGK